MTYHGAKNAVSNILVDERNTIVRAEDQPVEGFPNLNAVILDTINYLARTRDAMRFMLFNESTNLESVSTKNMVEQAPQVISAAQHARALAEEIGKLFSQMETTIGGGLQ